MNFNLNFSKMLNEAAKYKHIKYSSELVKDLNTAIKLYTNDWEDITSIIDFVYNNVIKTRNIIGKYVNLVGITSQELSNITGDNPNKYVNKFVLFIDSEALEVSKNFIHIVGFITIDKNGSLTFKVREQGVTLFLNVVSKSAHADKLKNIKTKVETYLDTINKKLPTIQKKFEDKVIDEYASKYMDYGYVPEIKEPKGPLKFKNDLRKYVTDILEQLNIEWEYVDVLTGSEIEGVVCNYIEFPFAENKTYANMTKQILNKFVKYINEDNVIKRNLGGPEIDEFKLVETYNAWYIIWNVVDIDDYQYIEKSTLNKMYNYCK